MSLQSRTDSLETKRPRQKAAHLQNALPPSSALVANHHAADAKKMRHRKRQGLNLAAFESWGKSTSTWRGSMRGQSIGGPLNVIAALDSKNCRAGGWLLCQHICGISSGPSTVIPSVRATENWEGLRTSESDSSTLAAQSVVIRSFRWLYLASMADIDSQPINCVTRSAHSDDYSFATGRQTEK